ncbi:hypothetical protein [Flavobacterium sp. '19STA2R22 D10 B1']|uniref:hypothetical protein n=1 Tax=Flavobacterium aerium TaxID=3037261 RepID=UPI00278BC1BB|nr:hypothetical protein [Flavobacterium sp. '19STA2R22 D10 B1']
MNIKFCSVIPRENENVPILISSKETIHYQKNEFIIIDFHGNYNIYELRYEYKCSPFKKAVIEGNLLAVGHEMYFHLFDVKKNLNVLTMEISGYFSHLYYYDNIFYVAGAYGVYAINKGGKLLWSNECLAIDGVLINDFCQNYIRGIGELDPPGGWEEFILDRKTGMKK